jgi:hypothetical protein
MAAAATAVRKGLGDMGLVNSFGRFMTGVEDRPPS